MLQNKFMSSVQQRLETEIERTKRQLLFLAERAYFIGNNERAATLLEAYAILNSSADSGETKTEVAV